jgi:hypothetical protein
MKKLKKIQLSNGTLCNPQIFQYLTKDSRAIFAFSYHKVNDYYEIDIEKFPSFEGRPADSHTIHWLPSPRPSGYKMCFNIGKEPKTLDDAKEYSILYAELVWFYIRTGVTIDEQLVRRN